VIAQRLPSHDWPDRALRITAIDVATGELVVFGRESGVGLVAAVAASCAVPGAWPPVTIGGRRYMDGGVAGSVNLPVAGDCAAAVVLVPSGADAPAAFGAGPAAEIAAFAGTAFAMFADADSLAAFGPTPLDPRCRIDAAVAGREQGRREARAVARFLGAWRLNPQPSSAGGAACSGRASRPPVRTGGGTGMTGGAAAAGALAGGATAGGATAGGAAAGRAATGGAAGGAGRAAGGAGRAADGAFASVADGPGGSMPPPGAARRAGAGCASGAGGPVEGAGASQTSIARPFPTRIGWIRVPGLTRISTCGPLGLTASTLRGTLAGAAMAAVVSKRSTTRSPSRVIR
jgi:hypothetical protein